MDLKSANLAMSKLPMNIMTMGDRGYTGFCEIFYSNCLGVNEHVSNMYRISSVIRRSFFSFQNNPKDLDPSCKMDLDLWDCLGRVKLVL